jgi:hypothetical protein
VARNKLSEAAIAEPSGDWTANESAVLARVWQQDPSTYLRVAFNTVPKDVQIAIEQRAGPLDRDEVWVVLRLAYPARSPAPMLFWTTSPNQAVRRKRQGSQAGPRSR